MTQSNAEDYGRRAEEARAKVEHMISDEARLFNESRRRQLRPARRRRSEARRTEVQSSGRALSYNGRRALNHGLCACPLGVGP